MGCDIHMCLEVKNIDGQWESAEIYTKNRYYDPVDPDEPEYVKMDVYSERNYSLFAALAGVRDYSPGAKGISDPRGFLLMHQNNQKTIMRHGEVTRTRQAGQHFLSYTSTKIKTKPSLTLAS